MSEQIDDLGLTPLERDDRLALLEILDDRYRRLGTIVTAQLPVPRWHQAIGEPTIADAVMDRLAHTPYVLDLKGGSQRKASVAYLTADLPVTYACMCEERSPYRVAAFVRNRWQVSPEHSPALYSRIVQFC